MDHTEEEYNELRRENWYLDRANEKLREERDGLARELSAAEGRVEFELKPRIEKEKKSYDAWVISGSGNTCFRNGMSGRCDKDCEDFSEECEQALP